MVGALERALPGAMRGFIDWALGFGASSRSFVTRTPAGGSYERPTVRSLRDFSRAVGTAGLTPGVKHRRCAEQQASAV